MKKRLFIFLFLLMFFNFCFDVFASESDSVSFVLNNYYYTTANNTKYYHRFFYSSIFDSDSVWDVPVDSDVSSVYFFSDDTRPLSYQIYFSDKLSSPSAVPSGDNIVVSAADMRSGITIDLPDDTLSICVVANTGVNNYNGISVSSYLNYSSVPTPVPTSAPTSVPTSAPVPSGSPGADLSEHDWKLIVYEAWTSENHTLSVPVTTKHVPYSTGNMEQHIFGDSSGTGSSFGVYGQVFTYRVKIPFRFECVDFAGIGSFGSHVSFDTEIGSGYFPDNSSQDMQVTFTYSTPWIESVDSTMSFDATGPGSGYPTGFNIHGASLTGETTPEYYYCFDTFAYVSSSHTFLNFGNELKVTLRNVTFNITDSVIESNRLPSDVLNSIDKGIQDTNETIKQEHQEEIDKSNEAVDKVTGGVSDLTGTLSSWQIFTMPVTLITDFVGAISSDGSTGFTFPSFTLMGQQLWPSYTFDLQVIADKFPLLYNSLHIISGILVVIAFIRYCWRKWHILTGDDLPDGEKQ